MHIVFLNPQGNFDPLDSFLTEHPDFGGQLVYVKELSMALTRLGHRVDIATRLIDDAQWPGFSQPLDHYPGYEDTLRILRIRAGGPGFLNKELLWPHLPEFVANLVEFYGADLPGFATAHYADGGFCAALLQQHAAIPFTFTGHSLGAQKLDKLGMCRDNAAEMDQHFHFSTRIGAERLSMQRAARIITSTAQERFEQYAHPLYQGAVDVRDDHRFAVIPPGVNTEIFTTVQGPGEAEQDWLIEQRTGAGGQPHIIVSSRLDQKKNILGVVEAYAGDRALQQSARLGLFVRGVDDPFQDYSALPPAEAEVLRPILDLIDSAGLREQVDFLSIHSQANLAAAYRYFASQGSVFALTAFYEPFGLAPIEAAACGLAVVATRNGGPSEIFADGYGVLVDPTDSADIARGLSEALHNSTYYAEKGIQRVLSTYTWDKTAQGYNTVIKTTAATRPGREAIPPLGQKQRLMDYLNQQRRAG